MKNKPLRVILAISLLLFTISIIALGYVVTTYYFKVNIVPVGNNVEETPQTLIVKEIDEKIEKPEESEEKREEVKSKKEQNKKQGDVKPKETDDRLGEKPEVDKTESSVSHSYLFEDRKDETISQSQEDLETQFAEAESFISDPQYSAKFPTFYPDYWKIKVLDCLQLKDGSLQYWYIYENTDVGFYLEKPVGSEVFNPMDSHNMFASDYCGLYFENGVPSNSKEIYEALVNANVPIQDYWTDYLEGDGTIDLYDINTKQLEDEEIPIG